MHLEIGGKRIGDLDDWNMMYFNPYMIVAQFEKVVAAYAGAPYGVAVDSCTNALLLSFVYRRETRDVDSVVIPKHTYVGVAQSVLNAGLRLRFASAEWRGSYLMPGVGMVDSARRFHAGMYFPGSLYCISFHWSKHLPIGRGGMILTDDAEAAETLRRMRFDGRTAGVPPKDDTFTRGFHCYLHPEEAARGLMLMQSMPEYNDDLPNSDYPDLSQQPIFQGGQ